MTWNYRIVRSKGILTIREVYYNADGNPVGMTKDSIIIQAFEDEGESLQTILDMLDKIKDGIEKHGILDDPWPEE